MTNTPGFKRELNDPLAALRGLGRRGDEPEQPPAGAANRRVPIDQLTLDERAQPRVVIQGAIIAEYAEEMRNGAQFPPIDVFWDGETMWVADGFHRTLAAIEAGETTILARVHQGDLDDAILFSVGANSAHGLRRTNADKRRAVLVALRSPKQQDKSAREIARLCGVSHQTVLNIEKKLADDGTLSKFDSVRYVDRWGNETTMDTGGLKAADRRAQLMRQAVRRITGITQIHLPAASSEQEREAVREAIREARRHLDDLEAQL